jgi:hypothetical protein
LRCFAAALCHDAFLEPLKTSPNEVAQSQFQKRNQGPEKSTGRGVLKIREKVAMTAWKLISPSHREPLIDGELFLSGFISNRTAATWDRKPASSRSDGPTARVETFI